MSIDITIFAQLILIVLTLKLIVSRWKPPIQESKQAILCILLGTSFGCLLNPTREGFVIGIISSGIAFYGKELIDNFKSIKGEITENSFKNKKK